MHVAPTFAAVCKYVVWLSLRCPCVVPVPECLAQLHDVAWVTMCKDQRTNAVTNNCYKPAAASNSLHDVVCTVFKFEVAVLCNFNFAGRMVVPNHMTFEWWSYSLAKRLSPKPFAVFRSLVRSPCTVRLLMIVMFL